MEWCSRLPPAPRNHCCREGSAHGWAAYQRPVFADWLANVEADYDLVLIDCAPSLNALTRTAWAASDRVTVVTEPGLFSVAAADRALYDAKRGGRDRVVAC